MNDYKVGSSFLQSPVGREPASETSGHAPALLVLHRKQALQQPVLPGERRQASAVTYSRLNTIAGSVAGNFLSNSAGLGRQAPHTAPHRLISSAKTTPTVTPVQSRDRESADGNRAVLTAQDREHFPLRSRITDVNIDKLKNGQEIGLPSESNRRPYTELVSTAARFSENTLLIQTGFGPNTAPSRCPEKPRPVPAQGYCRSPFSGPQPQQLQTHHHVGTGQREQFSGELARQYPQQAGQQPLQTSQQAGQLKISQPVSPQTSQPQQPVHRQTSPQQLVQRQTPQTHCYSKTELLNKSSGFRWGQYSRAQFQPPVVNSVESSMATGQHDQMDLLWRQLNETVMLFSAEKHHPQLKKELSILRKSLLHCECPKARSSP